MSEQIIRHVDKFVRRIALAGSVSLVVLVLLMTADVILRYLFNAPIFGGHDYAELLLLVAVATSIGYSARTGGQASVDFIAYMVSPRVMSWIDSVMRVASAAIILLLAYRCFLGGLNAAENGEASSLLRIPFLPFYFILGLGMLTYSLVLIMELLIPRSANMRMPE